MGASDQMKEKTVDSAQVVSAEDVDWDVETDVLIVGGGGCGLVAAPAASENTDLVVTVLEKSDELGGNTALSTGMIPAAGSRFQEAAGNEDSPNAMARDILEKNGHQADEEMVRRLCRQSRHLVHWLVDQCDVDFQFVDDFKYPRQSEYRMHAPPGRHGSHLVDDLLSEIEDRGNIELLPNVPVRCLVADEGAVVGVVAGERQTESIRAEKVLLATDGFGGNRRMVEESIGEGASEFLYYGV